MVPRIARSAVRRLRGDRKAKILRPGIEAFQQEHIRREYLCPAGEAISIYSVPSSHLSILPERMLEHLGRSKR